MEDTKKKAEAFASKKDLKSVRRGRNSVQKMKERREVRRCKQFLLKEIERKGEKHFYIVRKEIKEPVTSEVEDIFADWKNNFSKIKRPRVHKPRERKISQRAERKHRVKEARRQEE